MLVKRRQRLQATAGAQHRDRIFSSEMSLNRIDNDTIIILLKDSPMAAPLQGEGRQSVLGGRGSVVDDKAALSSKESVVMRLSRVRNNISKIEYASELEFGAGFNAGATRNMMERR